MVKFANEMEMLRRRPDVAVECYTETLEILYFMFLPGVLLCRARSLLKLVKHIQAIPLSSYLSSCTSLPYIHSENTLLFSP